MRGWAANPWSDEVINTKRALLFLPLYLVWVLVIEGLFNSASPAGSKSVPMWMVVGFIVSAVVVAVVVIWYLIARGGGKIPEQRHHAYMAILIAVVVSGFVDDALKGVAFLLLGGHHWWALIPVFTVGYAVFCAVLVYSANWLDRRTKGGERSNSAV